jgi:OHCU decarboxylase
MTFHGDRPTSWLDELNAISEPAAVEELMGVCSSRRWAERLAELRPYPDAEQLLKTADEVWLGLEPADWLEALDGHPRIGESGGAAPGHSRSEQAGVADAPDTVLAALREGNRRYEARFGHVFLISAAGLSAEQVLAELSRRLENRPETELREAAEQHRRITRLRLQRLLAGFAEQK